MSQTQLASMFIGKPYILDELQSKSKDINNLFILDKQDDRVLNMHNFLLK